jgi:hypothetical protein
VVTFILHRIASKSKKTSVSKVLIYHVTPNNDPILSTRQMILSQIHKSKENSPMLVNYLSSTHEQCEVALMECASVSFARVSSNEVNLLCILSKATLFNELSRSFHPQIIYVAVSSVDDVLKCFFSTDCNTSYTLLVMTHNDEQLPLRCSFSSIINKFD